MATDDTPRPSVRLGTPDELVRALPRLIGFPPQESVVLVSLTGPGGRRVGMTLRADLPPPEHARELARAVVPSLLTDAPAAAVVAVVTEAADLPEAAGPLSGLPGRELLRELTTALTAAGVPLREALLVRGGRWWSYECPDPCCAPGAGTPLGTGTTVLDAASALAGSVVEPDRAALQRRIAPPGPEHRAAMDAACAAVGEACARRLEEVGWEAVADESWELLRAAARPPGRAPARLSDAEVARLAWGLRDVAVRDRALGLALGGAPEAAEALWGELTRRAPCPLDVAPATLLAVSAWLRGDGAMANVALDRALGCEPGYQLAQLLRTGLDAALPPAALRELVASSVDELDAAC